MRGVVDTAQLPADVAGRAEAAVRALPFGKPPPPPSHPDAFQYQITVLDGGESQSAVINESDVSADLRPAVDAARRGAQPQ